MLTKEAIPSTYLSNQKLRSDPAGLGKLYAHVMIRYQYSKGTDHDGSANAGFSVRLKACCRIFPDECDPTASPRAHFPVGWKESLCTDYSYSAHTTIHSSCSRNGWMTSLSAKASRQKPVCGAGGPLFLHIPTSNCLCKGQKMTSANQHLSRPYSSCMEFFSFSRRRSETTQKLSYRPLSTTLWPWPPTSSRTRCRLPLWKILSPRLAKPTMPKAMRS